MPVERRESSRSSESVTLRRPSSLAGDEADSWWDTYARSLGASSISPTSQEVIELDSRYLLERGVHGDGVAGDEGWPGARVRRGLVMGAVQSGKTASMLGLTALSFDAGVDVVVILSGTRIALWRQTYERLDEQLLSPAGNDRSILVLPRPEAVSDRASPSLKEMYSLNGAQVRRALQRGTPILLVVMKNVHHLGAVGETIHERVLPAADRLGRPVHMLVLDDEADDGSILDARVEASFDPVTDDLKQIPRAIVDLWSKRPHRGATASPHFFANYVAYTATPQANFLQSDHNPLAPTDFVAALRTPFDVGTLESRETTYVEPLGLKAFYTGGETYYRRGAAAQLCEDPPKGELEPVGTALRAFLVATAIRLWRADGRMSLSDASAASFSSQAEAVNRSPRPSTMLIHPSPAISDHFKAAASVLQWAGNVSEAEALTRIRNGERGLPGDALRQSIYSDESPWVDWLERYRGSSAALAAAFGLGRAPLVPSDGDWDTVATILCEDVIPNALFSIVNSDPAADDRPRFEPRQEEDGSWSAAADLSTVFVSGNVMSRGLTLEGLTTTLFLRRSNDPYADTQMQMQRWFGYRGGHLELCRVFVPDSQLKLLRNYHEADEALRREVVRAMNETEGRAPSPKVIEGRSFAATGKIANVAKIPLCPGAAPFIRMLNSGHEPDPNVEIVAQVFEGPSSELVVNGTTRGRILDETLTLGQAADALDALRYRAYSPESSGWEAERWHAVEAAAGISAEGNVDGVFPLYRPPGGPATSSSRPRRDCPYAIAAYLRLWKACLIRLARGLVATDRPDIPWSMENLERKTEMQPEFYVGIRYGSGQPVAAGALGALAFKVRPMQRTVVDGQLSATWGSRNPSDAAGSYLGDEFFDYHVHGQPPPKARAGEPLWRPPGAPGLLLFHVVELPGSERPAVAVGLGIPLGGPDQFAAWSPQ